MTGDARFEDGTEAALYLKGFNAEGVAVISALVQDAVFPITEMSWEKRARRLSFLINRFRWEDHAAASRQGRRFERVQSVLSFADVGAVSSQGIDRGKKDTVLSILALEWEPGEDGTGRLLVTLAGDGQIAASCECIDVTLRDVTRPYAAASGKVPHHPD